MIPRRFLAVLAAVLFALAAPATRAQEPVTPPGSSFGIVPPPGFAPSPGFSGFADPATQASFLFVEMPPEAYAQLAAGLTAEALAGRGITVASRAEVAYGGVPGVLIVGEQLAQDMRVRKFLLVFRASDYTGMINVSLPPQASAHGDAAIGAALASLRVGPRASLEQQRAALPFTFAETASLRLRMVGGGGSAVLAFEERGDRLLIIAASLADVSVADRHEFARRALLQSRAAINILPEPGVDIEIAGCPGVETRGRGTSRDGSRAVLVIDWIGYCDGGYLRVEGITNPENVAGDLPQFQAVRDSLVRRR